MRVLKPQKLGILTKCVEQNRAHYFSVSILAYFPFEQRTLLSEISLWKFVPEELGQIALDECMPKTKAEVLVSGRAYPDGGEPRAAWPVRVQLGPIDKALYIIGDRHWKGHDQSEPRPFTEMPLTWERAFGGEGYEKNPLGKGFRPVETEHGPIQFLPNIETPGKLIKSPHQTTEPAGLLPYDMMRPQRFSKIGTYDQKWLKELFPGYARDFDWSFFNVAPADQQTDRPLRGDEPLRVEGMHPERHCLEGRLPGVRGRCFIIRRTDEGERFQEIETKLDTVWLFPHIERGVAIFHGMIQNAEDDGSDIELILIGAEWLDEAKPVEHYREVIARRTDEEMGAIYSLRDEDLLPPGIEEPAPGAGDEDWDIYQTEGLILKNARPRMEREMEQARERMLAIGMDPEEVSKLSLPPEEEPPSLEELPALAKKNLEEAEQRKRELEEKKAQKPEHLRGLCELAGIDMDAVLEAEPPPGPPTFRAQAVIDHERSLCEMARQYGVVLTEAEARVNDPAHLEELREQEERLREMYRLMAHIQQSVERLDGPEADRARQAVIEARERGESFERWDLTGADLSGLDLSGACFREAFLEKVDFRDANLAGADFTRAVLARSDLAGAALAGARLVAANLGDTRLTGVRLEEVDLSEAILMRSDLRGASLARSKLDEANLLEARFGDTDFSGVQAEEATFLEADLTGADFSGANLTNCSFLKMNLTGADFSGALLEKATFVECHGRDVVFSAAKMSKATFVSDCRFEEADFRGADLTEANLRSTALARADLSGARMDRADLSEAVLEGAKLYRAVAREARLMKTDLRDADLTAINLMGADVQKSDLRGTKLTGANLYGSNFAKVHADEATDLRESNQKKVTIYPLRRT